MTLLFKQIFAFFKLLNSDTGTNALAAGLTCGLILGFAPFISLQTILVFTLVFIFRIQLGAAFLSAFFFKFVAYLIDPVAHIFGQKVLESSTLRPLFITLYNAPIIPMTRFNNSIVMGSMVITLILAPFAFVVFKRLIIKYRETVVAKFQNTKFWKAFKATTVYNLYSKYDSLYG